MTVATLNKTGLPPGVEFKKIPFECKSVDEDQGIITGYLSTFGTVDYQEDRVQKGAFSKTLQEAKSRKMQGRKFLFPCLWMHDPEQPIGLVTDAVEDDHGLLITAQLDITTNEQGIPNNPIAVKVFSGFKMGYIDELSMGYKAIQKDYDKGVRNLKEVAVIEASAITGLFAANPDALVPASGVKSLTDTSNEIKGVTGDTSLPIGPRDEAWSGSTAQKQIFAWAKKDDDTLDASKLHKVFMVLDGDPQKKGSWSYPFCFVEGGKPHICVGAIKAIAGAIQGSRGASAPDGLKSKVETLYNRINKKYPNDPQLTPPWKGNGKMNDTTSQRKDFNDRYREERIKDWKSTDFCNLVVALQSAIMDMFSIGDEPQVDLLNTVLNGEGEGSDDPGNKLGFIDALKEYVQKGIDLDVSNYLGDNPYFGSVYAGSYGYMRRSDDMESKAGARFSQDTLDALQNHVKALRDMATEHKAMMNNQYKALTSAANDLSALWDSEGQGPAYDKPQALGSSSSSSDGKSRREPSQQTLTRDEQKQENQPEASTEELNTLEVALYEMRKQQLAAQYTH